MSEFIAVIEAGGTKFNCAIMDRQRMILADIRIPTTTPDETLGRVIDFFRQQRDEGNDFSQLGLASFGPLQLDPSRPDYGTITKTPKPDWSYTQLKSRLEEALSCQVNVDTDVNAAALAEYKWGAARGVSSCAYVTVGTGIGVGVLINGQPLHGLIHPEAGHILLPKPQGHECVCPFHDNCVEGMASGTAMTANWGEGVRDLPLDHPVWQREAILLGQLCHQLLMTISPQQILLGGGVMQKEGLLPLIHRATKASVNTYLDLPPGKNMCEIINLPGLGQNAGLFGAFALLGGL